MPKGLNSNYYGPTLIFFFWFETDFVFHVREIKANVLCARSFNNIYFDT